MIDANSLRIGNWVEVSNRRGKVYHYAIGSNDFAELEKNSQDFSPIPLTEEVLVACGFKYYPNNKSYQLDTDLGFSIWGRNGVLNIYAESDEIGEYIKSLHHLQNIYYSLTGKELVYQPS